MFTPLEVGAAALAVPFAVTTKRWMYNHNVVKSSLFNRWNKPSSKDIPNDFYYKSGHRWSTTWDLNQFSESNIRDAEKMGFKPLYLADFRIFNKTVRERQIPNFMRNRAERTGIWINPYDTAKSIYGIGGAGSGKTEWLKNIIDQDVYNLEVYYSKKGDFETLYYRSGVDIILNPKVDDGFVHDFLSEEMEYIQVYLSSLLDSVLGKGQEDYFKSSAHQRLSTYIQKIKMKEEELKLSTSEKYRMLLELFKDANEAAKNGKQKSEMDVMGTVRTVYNKALNLIAYRFLDESTRGFVVSDFLNKDNNKQRLFLSATDPSLEALLGATAAVLVKYNLAQPNTKTKLIAYYLDEFLSFSKSVDSEVIAEMSRVGRSKGMCTYKLFQSFPKFSEDEYKEIVANCQFIVFFPVTEPGSLEEIGKQVGDIEYLERKHVEQDNGKQTVETNIKDRIITPEIITSLQKEGHSHIFFSPKMQVLTKAYTRMSATDEKNWIKDIIENQIDSNKYYKFLDEFYEGEGKNVFEAVGIDEKEKSEYEKELNNLLKEIVADYQQQFKNNEEYLSYKLTTSPEKLDSKHGDYTFKTKQIRIFNMINISREHFVGTAIHELAHHIEYIDKGSTGHSKNFYTIYKRLIDIAVKKDFIKYSIMAKEKLIDSSDIRQLEKFFPELKQIGDKSKGKGEEVTHSW